MPWGAMANNEVSKLSMPSPEAATLTERDKYRAMWQHEPYRKYSPGETLLSDAIAVLVPEAGASFIDFGCGTGRAAVGLLATGYPTIGIDLADNCLDRTVSVPLLIADLAHIPHVVANYGLCCDVMEHIRPEDVGAVLRGIHRSCEYGVFFSIALCPDIFGATIGEPLHLSVQPAEWWEERLKELWPEVSCEVRGQTLLATCRRVPKGFRHDAEVA